MRTLHRGDMPLWAKSTACRGGQTQKQGWGKKTESDPRKESAIVPVVRRARLLEEQSLAFPKAA